MNVTGHEVKLEVAKGAWYWHPWWPPAGELLKKGRQRPNEWHNHSFYWLDSSIHNITFRAFSAFWICTRLPQSSSPPAAVIWLQRDRERTAESPNQLLNEQIITCQMWACLSFKDKQDIKLHFDLSSHSSSCLGRVWPPKDVYLSPPPFLELSLQALELGDPAVWGKGEWRSPPFYPFCPWHTKKHTKKGL